MELNMNRDELIELGKKITACGEYGDGIDDLSELFDKNVLHPLGSYLLFYPGNWNEKK